MRKIIYTTILLLAFISCNKDNEPSVEQTNPEQRLEINATTEGGNLVGVVSKKKLQENDNFKSAFKTNYTPDVKTLKDLKSSLEGCQILGYLATWCLDSKREIPKFYKIMEEMNFTNFDMVAVDYNKKANGMVEKLNKKYNLHFSRLRVPTFVILRNGKEVGRFVERSNISLEKYLLSILQKKS